MALTTPSSQLRPPLVGLGAVLNGLLVGARGLDEPTRERFKDEGAWRICRRVAYVAPVLAVIGVVHVWILWPSRKLPDPRGAWATDLIGAHLALSGVSLLLAATALVLLRRQRAAFGRAVLWVAAGWSYLGLSAYLAGVDQQVTPNVTPLVVGSLAVAMLFPMRPLAGLVGHLAALAVFAWLNDVYQADEVIRLSNRGNALAISMIAFMLARVLEGARAEELQTRLVNLRQQAELQRANEELQRLATRDALTGLENRRSFLSSAEKLQAQATRTGRPASVLMLDVDHFKKVNDRRGHAAGDEALRAVAQACQGCLRGSDVLGRTGGEEFAAVLPDTDVDAALEVAERIRARVEALQPLPDEALLLTISVGVAPLQSGGVDAVAQALGRADAALYAAKEQGRNRVTVWTG